MATITKSMIKIPEYSEWMELVITYFQKQWGLNAEFAIRLSVFMLYMVLMGNMPTVNSGFRSPKKQAELRRRWDAGDRTGIVARPAKRSKHSNTGFLGEPDATGVDISFDAQDLAGQYAHFFGLKWGGKFKRPDPVHFYI